MAEFPRSFIDSASASGDLVPQIPVGALLLAPLGTSSPDLCPPYFQPWSRHWFLC